ncbi:Nucleolar protein 12 [Entophlyctis luteolus]|nr:Nucleolar protein 12 [Entophlyctis luteolus]
MIQPKAPLFTFGTAGSESHGRRKSSNNNNNSNSNNSNSDTDHSLAALFERSFDPTNLKTSKPPQVAPTSKQALSAKRSVPNLKSVSSDPSDSSSDAMDDDDGTHDDVDGGGDADVEDLDVDDDDDDDDDDDVDAMAVDGKHRKHSKADDARESLEKNKRSVFVGNLPVETARSKAATKKLLSLFKKFGTIESVRFRSVAFANTMPRKVSFLAKEFHANRDSLNAYVVFKNEASVAKALELNGKIFEGKHLRVDKAIGDPVRDLKKSVFLGNLSFDVSDESIWSAFAECVWDSAENVRVIRDKKTNVGKGFGYVQFADRQIVPIAIKMMNGKEIEGRPVRVTKCSAESDTPNKLVWQRSTAPLSGAARRAAAKQKLKAKGGLKKKPVSGKR